MAGKFQNMKDVFGYLYTYKKTFSNIELLIFLLLKICKLRTHENTRQAGNGPSRRPSQGSKTTFSSDFQIIYVSI